MTSIKINDFYCDPQPCMYGFYSNDKDECERAASKLHAWAKMSDLECISTQLQKDKKTFCIHVAFAMKCKNNLGTMLKYFPVVYKCIDTWDEIDGRGFAASSREYIRLLRKSHLKCFSYDIGIGYAPFWVKLQPVSDDELEVIADLQG